MTGSATRLPSTTPDVKGNQGALGAAATGTAISGVDNPFVFTVDSNGPVLTGAETGLYLKNAGVTSGDKKETEATNNREWVKATFSLGTGGAPLDPDTVSATDFTVGGATPLEAVVNALDQGNQDAGSVVYLNVASSTPARSPRCGSPARYATRPATPARTARFPAPTWQTAWPPSSRSRLRPR